MKEYQLARDWNKLSLLLHYRTFQMFYECLSEFDIASEWAQHFMVHWCRECAELFAPLLHIFQSLLWCNVNEIQRLAFQVVKYQMLSLNNESFVCSVTAAFRFVGVRQHDVRLHFVSSMLRRLDSLADDVFQRHQSFNVLEFLRGVWHLSNLLS